MDQPTANQLKNNKLIYASILVIGLMVAVFIIYRLYPRSNDTEKSGANKELNKNTAIDNSPLMASDLQKQISLTNELMALVKLDDDNDSSSVQEYYSSYPEAKGQPINKDILQVYTLYNVLKLKDESGKEAQEFVKKRKAELKILGEKQKKLYDQRKNNLAEYFKSTEAKSKEDLQKEYDKTLGDFQALRNKNLRIYVPFFLRYYLYLGYYDESKDGDTIPDKLLDKKRVHNELYSSFYKQRYLGALTSENEDENKINHYKEKLSNIVYVADDELKSSLMYKNILNRHIQMIEELLVTSKKEEAKNTGKGFMSFMSYNVLSQNLFILGLESNC